MGKVFGDLKVGDFVYGFYVYEFEYTQYSYTPIKLTIENIEQKDGDTYLVLKGWTDMTIKVENLQESRQDENDFVFCSDKSEFIQLLEQHISSVESTIAMWQDDYNNQKKFLQDIQNQPPIG